MRDNNTHIDELFEAARTKPTELRLEDVDKMVAGFPLVPLPFDWSSIINLNSIIMTSVSAFIIAGSLMLYTGSAQNPETNPENLQQNPITQGLISNELAELSPSEVEVDEPVQETPAERETAQISQEIEVETPQREVQPIAPQEEETIEEEMEHEVEKTRNVTEEPNYELNIQVNTLRFEIPIPPKECDDDLEPTTHTYASAGDDRLDFNVSEFDGVSVAGSMDVEVRQGSSFKVYAEGKDEGLEKLKIEVVNGTLKVGTKKKKDGNRNNCNNYSSCGDIQVFVEMPMFDDMSVAGSGSLTIYSFTGLGGVDFSVSGSGNIDVEGELTMNGNVDCSIAGSGEINIDGTADRADISIAGSGDFSGLDLRVKDADISIAGSGNVGIHAEENLDISIAGSGDIEYIGDPSIKKSVTGSGNIRRY